MHIDLEHRAQKIRKWILNADMRIVNVKGSLWSNPIHGIKMVKRSLYDAAWILGIIAGIVCILFALLGFLGYIPEILEKPIRGITGMVSAGVLGVLGFLILGAARMIKARGKKATTGGIFLLIFGLVAYLVGGAIGAVIAMLTGLLAIVARYA